MLSKRDRKKIYKKVEAAQRRRIDNLRRIAVCFIGGRSTHGWENLARTTGQDSTYLIALAQDPPRRQMGERTARALEMALNLPPGALDQEYPRNALEALFAPAVVAGLQAEDRAQRAELDRLA